MSAAQIPVITECTASFKICPKFWKKMTEEQRKTYNKTMFMPEFIFEQLQDTARRCYSAMKSEHDKRRLVSNEPAVVSPLDDTLNPDANPKSMPARPNTYASAASGESVVQAIEQTPCAPTFSTNVGFKASAKNEKSSKAGCRKNSNRRKINAGQKPGSGPSENNRYPAVEGVETSVSSSSSEPLKPLSSWADDEPEQGFEVQAAAEETKVSPVPVKSCSDNTPAPSAKKGSQIAEALKANPRIKGPSTSPTKNVKLPRAPKVVEKSRIISQKDNVATYGKFCTVGNVPPGILATVNPNPNSKTGYIVDNMLLARAMGISFPFFEQYYMSYAFLRDDKLFVSVGPKFGKNENKNVGIRPFGSLLYDVESGLLISRDMYVEGSHADLEENGSGKIIYDSKTRSVVEKILSDEVEIQKFLSGKIVHAVLLNGEVILWTGKNITPNSKHHQLMVEYADGVQKASIFQFTKSLIPKLRPFLENFEERTQHTFVIEHPIYDIYDGKTQVSQEVFEKEPVINYLYSAIIQGTPEKPQSKYVVDVPKNSGVRENPHISRQDAFSCIRRGESIICYKNGGFYVIHSPNSKRFQCIANTVLGFDCKKYTDLFLEMYKSKLATTEVIGDKIITIGRSSEHRVVNSVSDALAFLADPHGTARAYAESIADDVPKDRMSNVVSYVLHLMNTNPDDCEVIIRGFKSFYERGQKINIMLRDFFSDKSVIVGINTINFARCIRDEDRFNPNFDFLLHIYADEFSPIYKEYAKYLFEKQSGNRHISPPSV